MWIKTTLLVLVAVLHSTAATVNWTDWTSAVIGTPGSASGTMMFGLNAVNVVYSGDLTPSTQISGGTNFYNPDVYTSSSVSNSPAPNDDILAFAAGPQTPMSLSFSSPVDGLVMAIVSLNSAGLEFDRPFTVLSFGYGYWGNGSLSAMPGSEPGRYLLSPAGEGHGTILFSGPVDSLNFTHTAYENWAGFTVGAMRLADSEVPEPASMGILGSGLLALALAQRRRVRN